MSANELLTAALYYGERGWPVLPLRPGGKEPILTGWPEKATTDPDQIRQWWTTTPDANIGILTVKRPGIVTIDSDEKNGKSGRQSIQSAGLPMPETWAVNTPTGGRHYYFQYPADAEINCAAGVLEGVDIRSDGGYVVATPSSVDGRMYTGAHSAELAPLPAPWVARLQKPPHTAVQSGTGEIVQGARNATLTRMAGFMRQKGFSPTEIEAALREVNRGRCQPPLLDKDVCTIARSIGRYAPADPIKCGGPKYLLSKVSALDDGPVHWQVKGLVERGTLIEVFGQWGSGKTFFVLDMLACIATGLDFHGREVTAGPVVYFCGEGQRGLARRLKAWVIENGVNLDDHPFYVSTIPAALCDEGDVAEVMAAVDLTGDRPVHVCFDTRSRNFGPGDPNGIPDMTKFVQACDALRYRYGATVSAVHHPGHAVKDRSASSFVWHAALDVSYLVSMINGTRKVVVEVSKEPKDFPKPENFGFSLAEVDIGAVDEEGKPVTSCVLRPGDGRPIRRKQPRGEQQQLMLRILRGLLPKDDFSIGTVAKSDWKRACEEAGISVNTFYAARRALIRDGHVIEVADGVRASESEI